MDAASTCSSRTCYRLTASASTVMNRQLVERATRSDEVIRSDLGRWSRDSLVAGARYEAATMAKPQDGRQRDLLKPALDQIVEIAG